MDARDQWPHIVRDDGTANLVVIFDSKRGRKASSGGGMATPLCAYHDWDGLEKRIGFGPEKRAENQARSGGGEKISR